MKVDENILKQIKSFFKEYAKAIYDILKSTNEICDFFKQRYSTLIN